MAKKIPWSWSRLALFEKCPKQFYHTNIVKDVVKPDNKVFERGIRIHKKLEDAVKFKDTTLLAGDPEVERMIPLINGLLNSGFQEMHAELELAWDISMRPTSWFGERGKPHTWNQWLRCGYDFAGIRDDVAVIWDWKTGKNWGYTDQLKLFAATAFVKWPQVQKVKTAYVYVDQKESSPKTFHRSSFDQMWNDFGNRQELIQMANESGNWEPKPSNMNCKWCPVTSCKNYKGG